MFLPLVIIFALLALGAVVLFFLRARSVSPPSSEPELDDLGEAGRAAGHLGGPSAPGPAEIPGKAASRHTSPPGGRSPRPETAPLSRDRARSAERAVQSTRRAYSRSSAQGGVRVDQLEKEVIDEVGSEIGTEASDWFGYGDFPSFAREALPGVTAEQSEPAVLLPGRPVDEDDMVPAIRYLWRRTDGRFPRLHAEGWRYLLEAVNGAANRVSWKRPASEDETRRILRKARKRLKRYRGAKIPPAAANYVFAEMNEAGLVYQAMNATVFNIAFIDHARALAAPSGLPDIEFERMEAWIWGYDFRESELRHREKPGQ